jgi:tRNA dimethylallyltransferase
VLADALVVRLAIMPERDRLYCQIDRRCEAMIAAGAMDEIRALVAERLDPKLPAMRAIGVEPLVRHLAGGMSFAEALARFQRDSRNLAKRQFTWIRGQMQHFRQVADSAEAVMLARSLLGNTA